MVRSKRGFTLIEISVVIVVLAMMAALVVPNLATWRESWTRRGFFDSALRTARDAQSRAVFTRQTWVLRWDDAASRLTAEPVAPVTEPTGTRTLAPPAEETDAQGTVRSQPAPEGLSITEARVDGEVVARSEWELRLYPDGTADPGGLQFDDAGLNRSLSVDAKGQIRWLEAPLPEESQSRWPAGELERRA